MRDMRQCISCFGLKPKTSYKPTTRRCATGHRPEVCAECVGIWIQRSIEGRDARITCPQCPSELDYFQIKELVDEAVFRRYEQQVVHGILEADPTFVWCAHACGSGQSHPLSSDEPIMTCHHCRGRMCVVHKIPWHSGLTCRQFDESLLPGRQARNKGSADAESRDEAKAALQRARDDAASRDLVRRKAKTCPKCRSDIQKVDGCDMMTCELLKLPSSSSRGLYENAVPQHVKLVFADSLKVADAVMRSAGYVLPLTARFGG
ncbi:hypothetical protein F5B18DRAFT_649639 [Nemania serpens]|nr:hypothetical protein F5B18DRAFT_649639 [Nemania serpens]